MDSSVERARDGRDLDAGPHPGGGAVLLSAIWVAVDGLKTENIRPGLVGLILVSVGLVLPLDSGSARATTAPPKQG